VIGTPELTILVPCATCGGKGRIRETFTNPDGQLKVAGHCYDCYGTGVTRTPVTCAGCEWWRDIPLAEVPLCIQLNRQTKSDWGCLSWTAKEATDGNG